MNKYQEALESIRYIVLDETTNDYNEPKLLQDFNYSSVMDLQELIDMHTKPLKFEEIKPNMWVWWKEAETNIYVTEILMNEKHIGFVVIGIYELMYTTFEDNHFYRYQPLSEV